MRSQVFAVFAAPGTANEQLWPCGSSSQGCDGDGYRGYQDGMTKDAVGKKGIATDRGRKTHRPHEAQSLQNIMPHGDIGDMAKRAHFMIEQKVP